MEERGKEKRKKCYTNFPIFAQSRAEDLRRIGVGKWGGGRGEGPFLLPSSPIPYNYMRKERGGKGVPKILGFGQSFFPSIAIPRELVRDEGDEGRKRGEKLNEL